MSYKVLFERYQQGRIAVPMLKIYVKKGIIIENSSDIDNIRDSFKKSNKNRICKKL